MHKQLQKKKKKKKKTKFGYKIDYSIKLQPYSIFFLLEVNFD